MEKNDKAKAGKAHNNRVYILIIILLLIIMLYMLNEMSILSRNLEKYKELDSYNNEQIQMIKYVLEHKNGLTNYGQLILDDKSLINDISKRKENDLDYFCDTWANECRISIIDEYTIAFVYKKIL